MNKRKTKFNSTWKDTFSWSNLIKGDTTQQTVVFAIQNFPYTMVVYLGLSNKAALHSKSEEMMKGQPAFISDSFQLSEKSTRSLSHQKLVFRAEILDALDLVDKNESLPASNGGGVKKYRRMFQDSNIAKKYNQQETKIKYTIQFGIALFVKEQMISDVTNRPFSFQLDETTTSQIKKQYNAYVTYFSYVSQTIVTVFCGLHCTAEDLVSHFYEFIKRCGLTTFHL